LAGLQAVFLPNEDRADTAAAEQQLMVRNDRGTEATCYSG